MGGEPARARAQAQPPGAAVLSEDQTGAQRGAAPVVLSSQAAIERSARLGRWLFEQAGWRPQTGVHGAPGQVPGPPAPRLVLAADSSQPQAAADLICAVYGALRLGVIPVVLDHGTGAGELRELTADADPIAVVPDAATLAAALGGQAPYDARPGLIPLGRPMHYTSGTTGRRKGVFSGALPASQASMLWEEERAVWDISPQDLHIVMSPLYHSAPLRFALVTLLAGGRVVLPGRFDVSTFLRACQAYSPSTTFTAPAQLQRLREHANRSPADQQAIAGALSGFRMLAHAGAPCPEPVKRWLLEFCSPRQVWEFYGSTEGQFTICSGTEWLERPGTVGRARAGRTLSLDEDGRIWCTVPGYARFSYWRDPGKTQSAWRQTEDGPAFTVGDAGHLDAAGYLFLHGRRDDLIISGGVNVYPAEVERVLAELPGVEEVAVFGVPDERWGQRVEAAIRGTADPSDVLAAAALSLAPARRPRRVHRLDDLPRTPTGKILRRELPGLLG